MLKVNIKKNKFMKYYLIFILIIFTLFSCEKEPGIPTGQGNKIELSVSTTEVLRLDSLASAKGIINNLGYLSEIKQHGHCWSLTPQPDITYSHTSLGYRNTKGDFESTIHGLNLNKDYYVRAYIANETHIAYGDQMIIKAVCGGVSEISYGQTYIIIPIGNQCWMAKNLNIGDTATSNSSNSPHSNVSDDGITEKYCYNNDLNNCSSYGGLYDWNEMMVYTHTEGAKGICPDGWHIPSRNEWERLIWYLGGNYVAGIKLKGNANDQFNALLKGYRLSNGTFIENNVGARFWTSSTNQEDLPYYTYLTGSYDGVISNTYNKYGAFNVRCLKNDN